MALITGAGSGIGRAIAHTFVKEGCTRLVLADINEASLQTVSAELKELDSSVKTLAVKADISSEMEVENLVDAAVKEFGAIHYAVNNAGITSKPRVRTHELETSSWERVLDVNLRGTWFCQRAELRQMLKQEATLHTRRVFQCLKLFMATWRLTTERTGAPSQRGAIVNVSSVFGILSHPTVGAVCSGYDKSCLNCISLIALVVLCHQSRSPWHVADRCHRLWEGWHPGEFSSSWVCEDPV